MRAEHSVKPGDWFGIPLPDGTWSPGHAARVIRDGDGLLLYAFAPADHLPTLSQCSALSPAEAVAALVCSSYGIQTGEWPLIGSTEIDQARWPVPEFEVTKPMGGKEVPFAEILTPDLSATSSSWEIPPNERGQRQRGGFLFDQAVGKHLAWVLAAGKPRVGEQAWWQRAAERVPAPTPAASKPGEAQPHAVILHIATSSGDLDDYEPLLDDLIEVLEKSALGEFDGTLRSHNQLEVILYGSDGDRLAETAASVARRHQLPAGTRIEVRPGPPGTPSRFEDFA